MRPGCLQILSCLLMQRRSSYCPADVFELCNGRAVIVFRANIDFEMSSGVLLGSNGCVPVVQWMFYDCLHLKSLLLSNAWPTTVCHSIDFCPRVSWMFTHILIDVYSLANMHDCPTDVNGCFVIVHWVSSSCPMDVLLESVGCQWLVQNPVENINNFRVTAWRNQRFLKSGVHLEAPRGT